MSKKAFRPTVRWQGLEWAVLFDELWTRAHVDERREPRIRIWRPGKNCWSYTDAIRSEVEFLDRTPTTDRAQQQQGQEGRVDGSD